MQRGVNALAKKARHMQPLQNDRILQQLILQGKTTHPLQNGRLFYKMCAPSTQKDKSLSSGHGQDDRFVRCERLMTHDPSWLCSTGSLPKRAPLYTSEAGITGRFGADCEAALTMNPYMLGWSARWGREHTQPNPIFEEPIAKCISSFLQGGSSHP